MNSFRFTTVLLILALLCGCEKRILPPEQSSVLGQDESAYTLTILLDLSGSFHGQMLDGGKAHAFCMQVIDRYFRERIGTADQIVIGQISANGNALLWQGTPQQLRQDFASASAFATHLKQRANPAGSLVHHSLVKTLEYMLSDPRLVTGKSKSAIFVLSDMLDNQVDPTDETKNKALALLSTYGQKGGTVGIYYCEQNLVAEWRQHLQAAGIKHSCVESEIVGRPNLPNFE